MPLSSRLLAALSLCWLATLTGCDDDDDECRDGQCVCEQGASCELGCPAPPCTAICAGDNPSCSATCANGSCGCGPESHCDFFCASPPCHVDCASASTCSGGCANGDCLCERGASCTFECLAGPCHVNCEGDNEQCDGTCANGTCACASGSSCRFNCADDNCHVNCQAGARCLLECPNGDGGDGCGFSTCAAGEPAVCSGGTIVACGMPCP